MRDRLILSAMAACALAAAPTAAESATPLMVANHLAIHVQNLDASTRFYADVLGLERMSARTPSNIVWLEAGGFELHLIEGRTQSVQVPREVHLAFRVADLRSVTTKLDAQRLVWGDFAGRAGTHSERIDGVLQIYFRDPDGYWIEVNQLPQ